MAPQALALRGLPAQLELAQLEFKDKPERPACPAQLELQGQEQLVPRGPLVQELQAQPGPLE